MATFPPAKGTKKASIPSYDCPPVSTGKGGIPASLKVKAAGSKDAPGVEKKVNLF
jgi:hypothetical protein